MLNPISTREFSGKKAKIAFVGAGLHSSLNLYPCIPMIPEIDLVAVCDLDEKRAAEAARNYGALRYYMDVDEMLGKEEIDGAIIVGPTQMMVALGGKILAMGIPCFLEKPLGTTVEELGELKNIAAENGSWGQVAYCKRFNVAYRITKDIISDKDRFGDMSMIAMKFSCGPYPSELFGLNDQMLVSLIGHEVHALDLVRYLGGDIESVFAYFHKTSEREHGYSVNFKFKSGAVGSLMLNTFEIWDDFDEYLSVSGKNDFIVVDQALYLRYHSMKRWAELPDYKIQNLSCNYRPNGRTTIRTEDSLGYRFELEHFAFSILDGKSASPGLDDAIAAVRFAYAIAESARSRREIVLS